MSADSTIGPEFGPPPPPVARGSFVAKVWANLLQNKRSLAIIAPLEEEHLDCNLVIDIASPDILLQTPSENIAYSESTGTFYDAEQHPIEDVPRMQRYAGLVRKMLQLVDQGRFKFTQL